MTVRFEDVEIVRSRRATVALQVKGAGKVVLRAPMRVPKRDLRAFFEDHREWLERALDRAEAREAEREAARADLLGERELEELARTARRLVSERLAHFAPLVGVTYGRVTIRCQKTRWGSCSGKGNLNFNLLLALVPPEVLDYVVVHELCHRLEMNHSPRFWSLVGRFDPGYRDHRAWLKEHGAALLARAGH